MTEGNTAKKHRNLPRVLLILLLAAAGISGGILLKSRLSLPPKGQIEIVEMHLTDPEANDSASTGKGTNVTVSGGGGTSYLDRIVARDAQGRQILLPFFDTWFEGADFISATHYGATLIRSYDYGIGYYDAIIAEEEAIVVCVYEVDGTRREVLLAEGVRIPCTEEDGEWKLSFPEENEALQALLQTLRDDRMGERDIIWAASE